MARLPQTSNPLFAVLLGGGVLVLLAALLVRPGGHDATKPPAGLNHAGEYRPAQPATARTTRPRRSAALVPAVPDANAEKIGAALAALCDDTATLKLRRQAAYDLVRIGTDAALNALEGALTRLPPFVSEAVADALGYSPHPRASALLVSMWGRADDATARSIAAALGRQGCADCLATLRGALLDGSQPNALRAAAAIGLGASTNAASFGILTNVFSATKDTDLAGQILEAIGKRSFAESSDFFQRLLDSPGTDSDLRIAAFQALNNAPAEATPLLLKYFSHPDPEVRAEAAWAVSTTETPGSSGAEILGLLGREQEAEVRLRLYQALANQESFDLNAALRTARTEPDAAARMAAYEMLASIEESRMTPELQSFFDQTAVPALVNAALHGQDAPQKLQAIMILQQAGTLASQQALVTLRQSTTDEQLQRALRGAQ